MLFCNINLLLNYCKSANFSIRAIQALTIQCKEFKNLLKTQRIRSIKKVRYRHLIKIAVGYNEAFEDRLSFFNLLLIRSRMKTRFLFF